MLQIPVTAHNIKLVVFPYYRGHWKSNKTLIIFSLFIKGTQNQPLSGEYYSNFFIFSISFVINTVNRFLIF